MPPQPCQTTFSAQRRASSSSLRVEAVLQVQQAGHQADRQTRAARRADAAAELAVEGARQILTDHSLGRPRLVGQLGRHSRLDRGPRQPRGQHRQRMLQVDHLVQARAKEVRRRDRQIPRKSGRSGIEFTGSGTQDLRRKASVHAGSGRFAGPTKHYVDGYRAVSKAEADDIAKHGFRPDLSGRSMQDK